MKNLTRSYSEIPAEYSRAKITIIGQHLPELSQKIKGDTFFRTRCIYAQINNPAHTPKVVCTFDADNRLQKAHINQSHDPDI